MNYLGRLIARAAPVPPKPPTRTPVADPFEAVEHVPALPPSTVAPAEPQRVEASVAEGPTRAETRPMLSPEQPSMIERTIVRETLAGPPPAEPPDLLPRQQESAKPIPPAAIETRVEQTERIEHVIEHHDRETISLFPGESPLDRADFRPITKLEDTESELTVEPVQSIVPPRPAPPAIVIAPEAAPPLPTAIVHPPSTAVVEKIVEPPPERPTLTIGRLIVDVVPTPPLAAPQTRRRTRGASSFRASSDSFFGLGQV